MKQLPKLTNRQQYLLEIAAQKKSVGTAEMLNLAQQHFDHASRITIIRDLNVLVAHKFLKREGKGRGVIYTISGHPILFPFDQDAYFSIDPDKRLIRNDRLSFAKSDEWESIFTDRENNNVSRITTDFQNRFKQYNKDEIQKELERITIEFSWKSSRIEGNTYSLLDTERLIKLHEEAPSKTHEEAVMILNHKNAMKYIWDNASSFKKLTLHALREIHDLIVKDLSVTRGFRKHPVGIIGTTYRPFDNVYQIKESLENLCSLVDTLDSPLLKALVAVAGISYIQPFADGNKRTSRLMGNALLLAYRWCPLSYRSVDEVEYKKAIILFYEQQSIAYFKRIFVEQYEFAVKNYFALSQKKTT